MASRGFGGIMRHGFGNIARATGRDDRSQFWIFAGVVFGCFLVIDQIGQLGSMLASIDIEEIGRQVDDEVSMQQMVMKITYGAMAGWAKVRLGLHAVGAALLLTAMARRLHDRGHAGWWALLWPVAITATCLHMLHKMQWFAAHAADIGKAMAHAGAAGGPGGVFGASVKLQTQVPGPSPLLVLAVLPSLWLIFQLVMPGEPETNRYGNMPD